MFLKIKTGSLISYEKTLVHYEVENTIEDFFINLSLVDQVIVKRCFLQVSVDGKHHEVTCQIEFNRFVDDGILNDFTLLFSNEKDKKFKRIKKAIKALTIKGN